MAATPRQTATTSRVEEQPIHRRPRDRAQAAAFHAGLPNLGAGQRPFPESLHRAGGRQEMLPAGAVIDLQRTAGNRAVSREMGTPPVQRDTGGPPAPVKRGGLMSRLAARGRTIMLAGQLFLRVDAGEMNQNLPIRDTVAERIRETRRQLDAERHLRNTPSGAPPPGGPQPDYPQQQPGARGGQGPKRTMSNIEQAQVLAREQFGHPPARPSHPAPGPPGPAAAPRGGGGFLRGLSKFARRAVRKIPVLGTGIAVAHRSFVGGAHLREGDTTSAGRQAIYFLDDVTLIPITNPSPERHIRLMDSLTDDQSIVREQIDDRGTSGCQVCHDTKDLDSYFKQRPGSLIDRPHINPLNGLPYDWAIREWRVRHR